jgi:hypothetical protein
MQRTVRVRPGGVGGGGVGLAVVLRSIFAVQVNGQVSLRYTRRSCGEI